MKNIIVTVIGGGSVNWMRGLMRDVYLLDEVDGGEIRLVDPNTENVEAVAEMLERFNEMRNKTYKISVVEDRKEALKNADFVMTTFSPGTMPAFKNDLEIPVKYGIRIPVSMTVGIPGISAALRTAPVMEEIVKDMEEVCPGAWLLNVTNPMSIVTNAMFRTAKTVKPVGMCHEFHALRHFIKMMFKDEYPVFDYPEDMNMLDLLYKYLPENGLEYTVAGINHFIWLTKATMNGKDLIPEIRKYASEHVSEMSYNCGAKFALCNQFGYLPIPGDRHLVEFYPSLCNMRNGFAMKYSVSKTTVDSRIHDKYMQLNEIREVTNGKREINWKPSGEEMTEIMRAIVTGKETTAIVNCPNNGQISNMPKGAIVETLAKVGKDGIKPKQSGDLPGAIGSICRLHSEIQEMVTEASLTGDRKLLLEAMSLDPGAGAGIDFSEIPNLMEDLLNANKKWLPRFFD